MPKWDYQTLEILPTIPLFVSRINDEFVGTLVKKGGVISPDQYSYPEFRSHLAIAGQDGWEVVGVSPLEGSGQMKGDIKFIVILKRLL